MRMFHINIRRQEYVVWNGRFVVATRQLGDSRQAEYLFLFADVTVTSRDAKCPIHFMPGCYKSDISLLHNPEKFSTIIEVSFFI